MHGSLALLRRSVKKTVGSMVGEEEWGGQGASFDSLECSDAARTAFRSFEYLHFEFVSYFELRISYLPGKPEMLAWLWRHKFANKSGGTAGTIGVESPLR